MGKHGTATCIKRYEPQQLVKGMYSEFVEVSRRTGVLGGLGCLGLRGLTGHSSRAKYSLWRWVWWRRSSWALPGCKGLWVTAARTAANGRCLGISAHALGIV